MAHKLTQEDGRVTVKQNRYTFPKIEGRFGLSIYLGGKEVFIGIQISDTIIETVTRKRLTKTQKGKVNVYKFD